MGEELASWVEREIGRGRGWGRTVKSRFGLCRTVGGKVADCVWGRCFLFPHPTPIGAWSLERAALSFGVRGEEGAGLRRRGRGRCPEVGAGRGSPRAAGSEVSAGAGSGCGTGRRGRDVGCGFSAAGTGGVGP